MNRLFLLALVTFLLLFTLSGCGNPLSSETENETAEETEKETMSPAEHASHYIPIIQQRNRETWNIELEFLELTDTGILIRIYDYDNLGFVYNPLYFVLEYYDGNNWTKVSTIKESNADREDMNGYVVPSLEESYAATNSLNPFSLLPKDTVLKSGHYRISKVLSGKTFSVEFDLTF